MNRRLLRKIMIVPRENLMEEFGLYISVLLKFLAASVLLERILEFSDKLFSFVGIRLGRKAQLLRLADLDTSTSAESVRLVKKAFVVQTAGILLGIGICYFSNLGILRELKLVNVQHLYWWDILLSGIFISGGSEPIHQLINFLKGHQQVLKEQTSRLQAKAQQKSPLSQQRPGERIGITYQGGLYPEKPGHGLRKINPQYIVVHHSGTSADAGFSDIVRTEQKERRNKRGSYRLDPSFHSVITFDGKYHHYCRWDSIGWHVAKGAKVSNANSLGLCFVGNFQPRRKNPSNLKNRPSEEQLETGAKLIALWRILYHIPERNVVAHSSVHRARIHCPGDNFPLERLIAKSTQILKNWQNDLQMTEDIERFKKQRFIYV